MSLATVYKTLQVLSGLRLVQELSFPDTEARFDSRMKPHLNLICEQCGSVADSEDRAAEAVVKAAGREGFRVSGQRLDVYGQCEKCLKKNTS